MWNFNRPAFTLFGSFLQCFRVVFDLPEGEDGAGEQILTLKQGRNTAAEFALAFCTLAATTGWPDDPLKLHFAGDCAQSCKLTSLVEMRENFGSTD